MPYQKVLVAYDRSEYSKNALDAAIELIEYGLAEQIVTIYVTETYVSSDPELEMAGLLAGNDVVEAAEKEFDEVREEIQKIVVGFENRTETVIETGSPKVEILKTASNLECSLIVMGSRGLGAIQGVLGSVSYAILRDSEVPVLIVK